MSKCARCGKVEHEDTLRTAGSHLALLGYLASPSPRLVQLVHQELEQVEGS